MIASGSVVVAVRCRLGGRFVAGSTRWLAAMPTNGQTAAMTERFERHRQPWTPAEIQKLHHLASKGASLAAICKALTRSEESVKIRAKLDKLLITKKR